MTHEILTMRGKRNTNYGLNGTVDLNASGYANASLSFFKTGEDQQEFVFAKRDGGTVSFDGLADSIVYLPTFYKNGQKRKSADHFISTTTIKQFGWRPTYPTLVHLF